MRIVRVLQSGRRDAAGAIRWQPETKQGHQITICIHYESQRSENALGHIVREREREVGNNMRNQNKTSSQTQQTHTHTWSGSNQCESGRTNYREEDRRAPSAMGFQSVQQK
jgi:hypothetical protein